MCLPGDHELVKPPHPPTPTHTHTYTHAHTLFKPFYKHTYSQKIGTSGTFVQALHWRSVLTVAIYLRRVQEPSGRNRGKVGSNAARSQSALMHTDRMEKMMEGRKEKQEKADLFIIKTNLNQEFLNKKMWIICYVFTSHYRK